MKTLDAIYGVPEETPVVQLFLPGGGQFGEVRANGGDLEIELWKPQGVESWVLNAGDMLHVIEFARVKLLH